ncbi:hypothetical protein [Prochlorococcus marinus]|nr:hypothetical protein [Prochlorococcus marinus]
MGSSDAGLREHYGHCCKGHSCCNNRLNPCRNQELSVRALASAGFDR